MLGVQEKSLKLALVLSALVGVGGIYWIVGPWLTLLTLGIGVPIILAFLYAICGSKYKLIRNTAVVCLMIIVVVEVTAYLL